MLIIVCAMYSEAKPLIDKLGLTRVSDSRFDEYANDTVKLVVSGVGAIASAVAVSMMCTKYNFSKHDFIINVGCCAGENKGQAYIINKITDMITGRTFYPDMLYKSDLSEAEVVSVSTIVGNDDVKAGKLYDCESAGFYQASAQYAGPHQIRIIKVVSDNGDYENVTAKQITELIAGVADEIVKFSGNIIGQQLDPKENTDELCEMLKCSKVMSDSLKQLIKYCALSDIDYASVIKEDIEQGVIPVSSKREGKIYLDELRKRLLQF